jgi:hypothetical protein
LVDLEGERDEVFLELSIGIILSGDDLIWARIGVTFELLDEVDVVVDGLLHKLAHLVGHQGGD